MLHDDRMMPESAQCALGLALEYKKKSMCTALLGDNEWFFIDWHMGQTSILSTLTQKRAVIPLRSHGGISQDYNPSAHIHE